MCPHPFQIVNESLPIFLDGAVSNLVLVTSHVNRRTQIGGGIAAVAISTTAIGMNNSLF